MDATELGKPVVDVSLEFQSEVCSICGTTNQQCCHSEDVECSQCHRSSQDCGCHQVKRLKLDDEAIQSGASPKQEILTLDPRGHGWRRTERPREPPELPDTCDMVLTHYIPADESFGRELYNSYGKLRNSEFLIRYGILVNWESGLENSVSLWRELFDTEHARSSGRCEYWKSSGYQLLLGVANTYVRGDDYETIFADLEWVDQHPTDYAFVDVSLVITCERHVFYPLSVWLLLLLLPDDAWTLFRQSSLDQQIDTILKDLTAFDSPTVTLKTIGDSVGCLKLLVQALVVRKSRYSERVDAILDGKVNEEPLDLVVTFIMYFFLMF